MSAIAISSGLALGLASTVHCAGMCGAVTASLVLAAGPQSMGRDARAAVLTHAGRISAYAISGAAIGAVGAPAVAWLDLELAFRFVQWAGAVALMWIGLSTAGLLPSLARLDQALLPISERISRAARPLRGRHAGAYAAGLAWGMMPCAMVYGALFTGMLTGSALGGATVMTAFGVGTMPGLVATAIGVRSIARAGKQRHLRSAAGLVIALFGFLTVWLPHATSDVVCTPSQELQLTGINRVR